MEAMHCLKCCKSFYSAAARQIVDKQYCECGGELVLGPKPLNSVDELIADINRKAK